MPFISKLHMMSPSFTRNLEMHCCPKPAPVFLNGYTIFELKETRGAPHLALGTCAFVYFLFVFARAQRSSYGHCGLRAKWSLEVNTDLW